MNQEIDPNFIHCHDCQYEGKNKGTAAKEFIIFGVILLFSPIFLPLIIVALAYLVWIISKPIKHICPACNSANVVSLDAHKAQSVE